MTQLPMLKLLNMPTEEIRPLVERCLAGDPSSMVALVERFQGQVYGLCYRMLGHRQDAEDAVQETLVRMLRSLHRWDSERDFEPWLLAIAGNRCRTMLSTRTRKPRPESLGERDLPQTGPEPQQESLIAEEVQLGLASLREEYRRAFELFHRHQKSYVEIGEILGCPVGTVKTWVHRARKQLAQGLQCRQVV